MISLSRNRSYSGWRENFIRACIAMAKEGCRRRELTPRGSIEASRASRCPDCQSDSYFEGKDLEIGKIYETADACFCANCERFVDVAPEHNYEPYDPLKVLQVLRTKIRLAPPDTVDSDSPPCPICGGSTWTFHKDLGGIDYCDNYWIVCRNPFCDWPGAHREEFEWGPYTPSSGPSIRSSDTRRYQSVFISYNTKDHEFAEKLNDRLERRGLSCWYAPHRIRGGNTIREQLHSAVRKQERLLLILSEASMSSEWVQYEISEARKRELAESRRVLFPISLVPFDVLKDWVLEDDESPDLAREVRKYYIPDFSCWRDNARFETEFEKLLDALAQFS